MFSHAFTTWLLANLLHPLIWFIYLVITGNNYNYTFSAESFSMLFIGFFYSLIFSIPCLLLSWCLLQIIAFMNDNHLVKFIAWLFGNALLIVLEVWIIILLLTGGKEPELLLFSLPAIAATWLAIAIRWKQFKNLILHQKTNDHENNLV
jgi:hypothetical protein